MSYTSRADLFYKVDWEGGSMADALEYGLKLSDVPENDSVLRAAWAPMQEAWSIFKPLADKVYDLLSDAADDALEAEEDL